MALTILLAGAVLSLALLLYTGRHNDSTLLLALFTGWVLSPFLGLLAASVISIRWPALTRATLYSLMPVLGLGSLLIYKGLFSPPGTKPAFVFLVVPGISWLVIFILISVTRFRSRR